MCIQVASLSGLVKLQLMRPGRLEDQLELTSLSSLEVSPAILLDLCGSVVLTTKI